MRTLYFDCFSGASGDMLLGALVDLGVELSALEAEIAKLHLEGVTLRSKRVLRSALGAVKVDVIVGGRVEGEHGEVVPADPGHHHEHEHEHDHEHGRSLGEILEIIERSELSGSVKARASRAFERLGDAEALAHGTTREEVHFHEVGAADAIVDVVGAFVGFELLGVDRFVCSPLNVGGGAVTFSHGTYPVPTPATLELLRGAPVYSGEPKRELVTPTGAAVVTTVAEAYGPMPEMRVDRVGYGAGTRDVPKHPNVLRLVLGGEASAVSGNSDRVAVLEAAIDDMPAEALGFFVERALAEGALDVYLTPVQMKKGRPGTAITVLAASADLERMVRLMFRETTTIGLRHREAERRVLDRDVVSVETPAGAVRVKVARLGGEVVNAAPEYDDCREAALRSGVPLREVQAMAVAAWRAAGGGR